MKKLLLITLLIPFQLIAQKTLKDRLLGEWIKTDVRLADGSAVYLSKLKEGSLRYIFEANSSLLQTIDGKTSKSVFHLVGDTLYFGTMNYFVIEKLTDTQLVLQQDKTEPQPLKIFLEPARFHNVGFEPETYISKGNDTIYVATRNFLEPYFMNTDQNIMEYIYSRFDFPENKDGKFTVRFIITDKGELRAIRILEGMGEKYDKRLADAIRRTIGKWLPAKWEGKPVNTEMTLFFDMKQPDNQAVTKNSNEADPNLSDQYFNYGVEAFQSRNYKGALEYFGKSIEKNPYNIDSYYNRAACYIVLKQKDGACKDFRTLIQLEQKKAEGLYQKFCK